MGILNVTPDSFSDGGLYFDVKKAVLRAKEMVKEGADIIDVGGESTRPGSELVDDREQIQRIVPVIKEIRKKIGKEVLISVDTNKAQVAEAGIDAGANIINSLGGFAFDPLLAEVVARKNTPIVVYHIKGDPKTMQKGDIKYKDIISEINIFFGKQILIGKRSGVKKSQFIFDPGIGFGKSTEHNLEIIKRFHDFKKWRLPLLIGSSRKSHLGKILQEKLNLSSLPWPIERIEAGLAEVAFAVLHGAQIVRTHDVMRTKKFLTILDELKK